MKPPLPPSHVEIKIFVVNLFFVGATKVQPMRIYLKYWIVFVLMLVNKTNHQSEIFFVIGRTTLVFPFSMWNFSRTTKQQKSRKNFLFHFSTRPNHQNSQFLTTMRHPQAVSMVSRQPHREIFYTANQKYTHLTLGTMNVGLFLMFNKQVRHA